MTTRVLRELPDWVWDGSSASFESTSMTASLLIESMSHGSKFYLKFSNLAAYRFANSSHAKEIASDSFCKVVEVLGSKWASELNEPSLWPFVKRHFAVFIEEIGYYEFLAEEMHFE